MWEGGKMNIKEGIKNLSLTFSEIEMLKYSTLSKITELSNRVERYPEDEDMIEAEIERYSYLYAKLCEALL